MKRGQNSPFGEALERDDVREVGLLPERVTDVDGEGILGDITDDDDSTHDASLSEAAARGATP